MTPAVLPADGDRPLAALRDIRPGLVAVVVLLGLLYLLGALVSDRFNTAHNLLNVYEQSTALALVSLGQTMTILTGGIDLSVGSLISLLSVLCSGIINGSADRAPWVALMIVVLGTLIGGVNGLAVIVLRVHPLIVTLGMGAVLQGVTLLYSLTPPGSVPDGFDFFAYGRIGGVPVGASVALVLFVLTALFLRFHRYGRYVFAIGADDEAAKLAGLPRDRVLLLVYAFSGACSAFAALALVARFGVGQPYAGYNFTLGSITPVVVGGTLLSGGVGGVMGTLFGTYLIGLLYNVLNYLDFPTEWQLLVQGLVVILAVSVYVEKRKLV